MLNLSGKASAAHIRIKPKPQPKNLLERLRQLVADCGPNKNDQAIVAITVCIGERIDTTKAICEVLARLGFDTRHVAMMLIKNSAASPGPARWRKDGDGHHHLLP
ncbi:hypothetical protein [Sphingomonas faeni]|uniref:hypothetical protein n=1 Tax=Sphingomonas faeni TaxID=185950 RepID=UPI0020BEFEDA|nr:hypothetical protein [Sphingomonas faeni]MCK8457894.1 hypothetical protein [Sphingomonas faeni]